MAASALQLAPRDRWIGWDAATRLAHLDHLHRVVGLCRFLIRPGVLCRNLASHVLGRVVRALPEDFEALYELDPSVAAAWCLRSTCTRARPFRSGSHLRP